MIVLLFEIVVVNNFFSINMVIGHNEIEILEILGVNAFLFDN